MRIIHALAALTSILLVLPSLSSAAPQANPAYREGVHYYVLPEPVEVADPEKIEVTEVFWYGCSHCFHFEPKVLKWSETIPEDINFVHLPAMWSRPMEAHARAFYTAEALGIRDKVHQAMYDAINIDRKRMDKPEEVAALFAEHGADPDEVIKIFNSVDITRALKEADRKARAYQISGTPQIIVHGRYRIEANQRVSHDEMFKVTEFLADKIRAERAESN